MNETVSLNGLTRTQTDANIRKHFGTLDDFSVSSLSSQHGALSFIDEGSTRRKEIIAKFLDLELFEQKFKLAKEDSVDLKGALKRLETKNYDEEIEASKAELAVMRTALEEQHCECQVLKERLTSLTAVCTETQEKIDSIPAEIIDIAAISGDIRNKENQLTALKLKISEDENDLKTKQKVYQKVVSFLEDFELEKFEELKRKITKKNEDVQEKENTLNRLLDSHSDILKKQELLSDIPCGTRYPSCKFIRDAHVAVANKATVESEQSQILKMIEEATAEIKSLNPMNVDAQLEKFFNIQKNKHSVSSAIADLNLEIERNKNTIHTTEAALVEFRAKRDEYEDNKEAIENLEALLSQLNKCHYNIENTTKSIEKCENATLDIVKSVGSLEQKVENIMEQKKEFIDLQRELRI